MENFSENDYYADQEQTLSETIAVVVGKMVNKMPMLTAKEELVEDFLEEWSDIFGWETAK